MTAARVRDATAAALAPLGLQGVVEADPDGMASLFHVSVRTAGTEHRFSAGWAGGGWRPDVERLFALAPGVEVVYARRLSDEAKQWLESHQLGWVDEAGSARIFLPSGLVVRREEKPPEVRRRVPSGWTRSMLAAAEAALAGIPPTVEAIEVAAGLSRGSAANALSRLEQKGLLVRPAPGRGKGAARRVSDIDALVDEYAAAAALFRERQSTVLVHRLWKDPVEVLENEIAPSLEPTSVVWVVTGAAASTLLAPYLSDVTVLELYVARELFVAKDHLAELLGGRVVDRGHRIEVREMPTPMSAKGPIVGSVQVALPARVYADLMAAGDRFAEAAHHLREVWGVRPGSQ